MVGGYVDPVKFTTGGVIAENEAVQPDYEFRLGATRHLRGRGWRGLVALALILAAAVILAAPATTTISTGIASVHTSIANVVR